MKKSNMNVLLVALTSAVALAGCGSGSSPTPAPTPTPVPTPSPTPSPTPTPTPTPVPGESGVYALAGSGINATYSTSPSTNAWTNFASGTNQPFVAGVASESAALLLSTGTNANAVAVSGTTTVSYGIFGTAGAQVASKNTSIPVTVRVNNANANANTVTLPAIPARQIASNGSNAVVLIATAATVNGAGANKVIAGSTPNTFNLYTISSAGVPTALAGYYNLNGAYTSLANASVQSDAAVFFVNGMYYAYNVTVDQQLLQSSDGVTWQQITNNTSLQNGGGYLENVVQVSGSVFAAVDDNGNLYLGSSPANMTYIADVTFSDNGDFIAANGTGVLYTYGDSNHSTQLATYTPTATTLGSVTAVSTSLATTLPVGLVFAGANVYTANSLQPFAAGTLSAVTISGSTITQADPLASTVTADGTLASPIVAQNGLGAAASGRFLAMGSKVLVFNSNTQSIGGTGAGEVAAISAVAASGAATYNNLPTGTGVTAVGFAGTTKSYMLALSNGDVLVSSANGFVQASTVLEPVTGDGAMLSQLAATNTSYLASDVDVPTSPSSGNLYYSADNGTSWTTITPTDFGNGASALSILYSFDGLYTINIVGNGSAVGAYQTATPQILSTWVKVNTIPIQARPTYWDGTYYAFINGSNDVGVYNPTTDNTIINVGVLPQNAVYLGRSTYNIGYSGSSYALAQVSSNYLWTSDNLIGGIAGWTQNTAVFTGVNGAVLPSETFSGGIVWTGEVWVVTGSSGNMYTTTLTPTAFTVGTYTNTQGVVTAVNAGASSGLF